MPGVHMKKQDMACTFKPCTEEVETMAPRGSLAIQPSLAYLVSFRSVRDPAFKTMGMGNT